MRPSVIEDLEALYPMRNAWSTILSCLCLANSVHICAARGETEPENPCSDQALHGRFIDMSLAQVQEGHDRDKTLKMLSCIANNPRHMLIGPAAIRAMFHIAEDNTTIQRYLLGVIADPGMNQESASASSKLIVYVVDEDVRRQLLELAKQQWIARGANPALWALVELGDTGALRWLEKTTEELGESNPLRLALDRPRKMILIQQNILHLIAYLESDRADLDRGWVVRQAMRHGASREDIRLTVVGYLHRRAGQESSAMAHWSLIKACDECGIFTNEDVRNIEAIQRVRDVRFSSERSFPGWATLPDTKRAEFYGLNR